jgi:imidazolonepropionase
VSADIFCEPGFFSPAQTQRYLSAARSHDLALRAHCDEMSYSGAAATAIQSGADTVDHCNYVQDNDIDALVARGIVTVACPATTAYLGLPPCPVRAILERGGFVALASDYNPGTSPCFNLQTVAHFGRRLFGLSAAEALFGVTVSAAKSLRAQAGRIRVGEPADFVALRIESPEAFGFEFGGNLAAAVFRGGRRIL